MDCFEYYYKQEGMWSTNSIEDEWNPVDKQGKDTSSDISNVEEGEENNERESNNEGQNQSLVAIKNDIDDEEARKIQASQSSRGKRSGSCTDKSGQGGKRTRISSKDVHITAVHAGELIEAMELSLKVCMGLTIDLQMSIGGEAAPTISQIKENLQNLLAIQEQLKEFSTNVNCGIYR